MAVKSYTLPFKPDSVNQHWKNSKFGGKRISKEGQEFRKNVQNYIKLYKPKILTGRLRVKINLYFADNRRRDIDNYFKAILDCFNGILYLDDSQIDELRATKNTGKGKNYFTIELEEIKQ